MSFNNVIPGDMIEKLDAATLFSVDHSTSPVDVATDPTLTEEQRETLLDWIAELRSGKHQQVTGTLTEIDSNGEVAGHCCLGVLEERLIERGLIEAAIGVERHYAVTGDLSGIRTYTNETEDGFDSTVTAMPHQRVLDLAGLGTDPAVHATVVSTDYNGDQQVDTGLYALTELNDTYGWTFEQIADALEEHFGLKAAA